MDGIEATLRIKQMGHQMIVNLEKTKFILYSCLSATEDVTMLSENFDDIAQKPADINDLKRILLDSKLIN